MSRRRAPVEAPPGPPPSEAELASADAAMRAQLGVLATALFLATGDLEGITGCALAGRLPRIGDDEPPWSVRGWLLPYVMDLWQEDGRWRYWLDTWEAGALLPRPIPRIAFDGHSGSAGYAVLDRAVRMISEREGFSAAAGGLVDWLAWGLHVSDAPCRLLPETCEKLYRGVDLAPVLSSPCDYLGRLLSEFGSRYDHRMTGFFPTPMAVCTMMALMNFHDVGVAGLDSRSQTVMDPCVGTGAMLLAASNHSLRLYGMDINPVCVSSCKVQGALFAPWLSFPFPESFFAGAPPAPSGATPGVSWDDRGQGLLFGEPTP